MKGIIQHYSDVSLYKLFPQMVIKHNNPKREEDIPLSYNMVQWRLTRSLGGGHAPSVTDRSFGGACRCWGFIAGGWGWLFDVRD